MDGSGNAGGGGSHWGASGRRQSGGFTEEQVEALETVFAQWRRPTAFQRMEMKRIFPVLTNLHDTQLKVWFQNRRNLKRPEDSDVNSVAEKLTITNKLLKDENDRLMKKVTELLSQNDFLHQQLHDDI